MDEKPLSDRLAAADCETLKEILREAELHLTSQQAVALAADQRALTLTGFLAAAVVVLVGAASGYALSASPNLPLTVICSAVASTFMVAIWLAVKAAAPAPFDFAGTSPANWLEDIDKKMPLRVSLAEQCAHLATSIGDNHERMARNGKKLRWAINIAFWALGIGAAAFITVLVLK